MSYVIGHVISIQVLYYICNKIKLKFGTIICDRLGFIVDFLSHATIVGFMAGAATVVIMQQMKGVLGLEHFTHKTDVIDVLHSIFTQTHRVFYSIFNYFLSPQLYSCLSIFLV